MKVSKFGLYTLFSATFMTMMGFGIILPTLPFYARKLGASGLQMGLFMSLFALFQFLGSPVWGTISDRIGRKRVLLIGMTGYGISFFIMGMAHSFWVLLVARSFAGMLSGATYPTAQAYVADVTLDKERGPIMGQMGAANNIGFILGPVIGGILSPLGVRSIFFVAGSFVLLTVVALGIFLRDVSPTETTEVKRPGLSELAAIIHKPYGVFFILVFIVSFASSTNFSMISYYLIDKVGSTQIGTSALYTVMGGASALCQGFLIKPATKRWGELGTMYRGMALAAIGYIGFTLAPTLSLLIVAIMFSSLGNGLLWPTMTAAVSTRTDMGQGLTMGIQSSFSAAARTLGPLWGGFIYDFTIIGPCLTASVISIVTAVLLPTITKKKKQQHSISA